MQYKEFNDYELLSYVCDDETSRDILFEKYKPAVVEMSAKLFSYCGGTGLEINDLIQEGMLGLNDAIINFNDTKDAIFYTFAYKCIKSKIASAIVKAHRLKNKVLNESALMELTDFDASNNFGKSIMDESFNPETILIDNEDEKQILEILDNELKEFEKKVIDLKIDGYSYQEIADILGVNKKTIDNTIQKIKKKIRKKLEEKK